MSSSKAVLFNNSDKGLDELSFEFAQFISLLRKGLQEEFERVIGWSQTRGSCLPSFNACSMR